MMDRTVLWKRPSSCCLDQGMKCWIHVFWITLAIFVPMNAETAMAQEALLSPREGEVLVGPIMVEQDLVGIQLTSRVVGFLAVNTSADRIIVRLRVVADLAELQSKIGQVVDRIPLPTNNCEKYGIDNVVVRIWGKNLRPGATGAELEMKGDVDVWTCAKNPAPCSRVDWELREVGLGIKTNVPVIRTWECNPPIKNRNLRQPFTARIKLQLTRVGPHAVALAIDKPSVDLGGPLGSVTEGILRIAGIDVSSQLQRLLDKAVDIAVFKPAIPDEIARLNPTITSTSLFDNAGTLAATVEMEAAADGASLTQLLRLLLEAKIRD